MFRLASTPVTVALVVLMLACVGLLDIINSAQRQYVSAQTVSRLEAVKTHLRLQAELDLDRVRRIADDRTTRNLAYDTLMSAPDSLEASQRLAEWLESLVLDQRFAYFLLIDANWIARASNSTEVLGVSYDPDASPVASMLRDSPDGTVSGLTTSTRALLNPRTGQREPVGTQRLVTCTRMHLQDDLPGYLCLISSPFQSWFSLLELAWTGNTGEAYLIDDQGRLISPSRFLHASDTTPAEAPMIAARTPGTDEAPLTQVAQRLLANKGVPTGYLEGYRDYRGREVVGAGQWLVDVGAGLIVEEDMEEVFYVSRVANTAVTALGVLAFALIVLQLYLQRRSQRALELLNSELESRVLLRTRELSQARDEAAQAARAKAEFLANMSHEIRTPLNAILGMSHLAAHHNRDVEVGHCLDRIHESGRLLLGVINDILDFSKLEAGKLSISVEPFSLAHLIARSVDQVSERAAEKSLALQVRIAPELPDYLLGDHQHLAQILVNFLSNAVKFTERGGVTLDVSCVERQDESLRLRFAVTDNGIGIPADKLEDLFQPFRQVDNTTTRSFEGTGLGLAICRELATLMGGTTGVSSRVGQGSTFHVELPLHVASAPDTETVNTPQPTRRLSIEPALQGRRVLLVEDNPVNREVGSAMLKLLGLTVLTAADGEQALRHLHSEPVDLVLMDLHMPVMDGLQATQAIRADPQLASLPVLALTADVVDSTQSELLASGVNALLNKPIDPAQLRSELLRWMPPNPL